MLEEKLIEAADKLMNLAEQYGPDTVDLVLASARVSGINDMVSGVVAVAVLLLSLHFCRKIWRARLKGKEDWDALVGWAVGAIWLGILASVASVVSIVYLTDAWTWTAIIEPKIYIAHKVLGI